VGSALSDWDWDWDSPRLPCLALLLRTQSESCHDDMSSHLIPSSETSALLHRHPSPPPTQTLRPGAALRQEVQSNLCISHVHRLFFGVLPRSIGRSMCCRLLSLTSTQVRYCGCVLYVQIDDCIHPSALAPTRRCQGPRRLGTALEARLKVTKRLGTWNMYLRQLPYSVTSSTPAS